MSHDIMVTLEDIIEACDKVIDYSAQLGFVDFARHDMGYDAIIRRIAVIGEAASRLSPEFRAENPDTEWRRIIDLRNIVVHQYSGIDDAIVWDVATNRIPALRDQIIRILTSES